MIKSLSTAFLLAAIPLAGCSRTAPPVPVATASVPASSASASALDTYGTAYRALMNDFKGQMQTATSQPLPKAKTRQERQEKVAQSFDEIARIDADFVQRLEALSTPPPARSIHEATRRLLAAARQGNQAYADAVRRGDRAEIKRVGLASDKAQNDAMRVLAQAVRTAAKTPNLSPQDVKTLSEAAQQLTPP